MATKISNSIKFGKHFTRNGKIYSLIVVETEKGNKRAYIDGKKVDKSTLGYLAKPCSWASIYWYKGRYEDVLRHMMYGYFNYEEVQHLFNCGWR